MKDGEYATVRKAAIDAGIAERRFSINMDPWAAAKLIVKHYGTSPEGWLCIEILAGLLLEHVEERNDVERNSEGS